eukprot:534793_1
MNFNVLFCLLVTVGGQNTTRAPIFTDYNGPASNEYFNIYTSSYLASNGVPKTLSCGSWSTGELTYDSPVHYYKLTKTSAMMNALTSTIISTCCDWQTCGNKQTNDCNIHKFGDITRYEYYKYTVFSTTPSDPYYYYDNYHTNLTIFNKFCQNTLDTILYMLHEKNGKYNLITTADDSSSSNVCGIEKKSYIDLSKYDEGTYYIGVGGYNQEIGEYFIHVDCDSGPQAPLYVNYNGPASSKYFQMYGVNNPSKLLGCGDWYTGLTTYGSPVDYYKVVRTHAMDNYKAALRISTCCQWEKCAENDFGCNVETFGSVTGFEDPESSWGYSGYYITDFDMFRNYCDKYSSGIDTVLYLLYEKSGQLNLITSSDDSPSALCKRNSEKSYINLANYEEGTYIIGIGGYQQELGSYFIHMDCEYYSFPAESSQMNPGYNNPNIACWQAISDTLQGDSMKYYKFTIDDSVYLPVTISICTTFGNYDQWVMSLIHLDFDGAYSILDQDGFNIWQFITNDGCNAMGVQGGYYLTITLADKEKYQNGDYIIALQFEDSDPIFQNYPFVIYPQCSYAPTKNPTIEPTNEPTSAQPTSQPTMDPTLNPSNAPSIAPTMSPTNIPTSDPTVEPTSDPTNIPTIDPTNEPTIDPTFNPSKSPTTDPTPSPTLPYTFPIQEKQFKVHESQVSMLLLKCGEIIHNQENNENKLVSYFNFTKTSTNVYPTYISTCFEDNNNKYNYNDYKTIL